jgi:hypothetical protein
LLISNTFLSGAQFPMTGSRIQVRFALSFILLAFVGSNWGNPVNAQSPAGKWRGEWKSQSTGHQGPMRANIRPQGDGTYSARFSGRFFVVLPFTYRVDLVPTGWGGYSANKELGPLMGSYRMQTQFGSGAMSGRFQAAKDVGAVEMSRVR